MQKASDTSHRESRQGGCECVFGGHVNRKAHYYLSLLDVGGAIALVAVDRGVILWSRSVIGLRAERSKADRLYVLVGGRGAADCF